MAVDDEPPALQLIASYIAQIDSLDLIFQTTNSMVAYNFIRQNEVELLFLDIQMPGLNGLDFIKSLHQKPTVILTTAFREYAVEGFELDVLDYLVKPVKFERFLKAVSKYSQLIARPSQEIIAEKPSVADEMYIYFNVNKEMVKVFLKDILYIESIKDYIKVITTGKTIVTYQRITYIEQKLPENSFIRIHKSFIVSLHNITSFKGDIVQIGHLKIPIGRFYKKKFVDFFASINK